MGTYCVVQVVLLRIRPPLAMRIIIFLALVGSAIAVPKDSSRIVGGSATIVDRYPYMSNMQYFYFGFFWLQACGGSVINDRSVLTAAHCYFGDQASEWRVRLGTSFASSGGSVYNAQQLILHPQYNDETYDNDIALVRLASNIVFSDVVQMARVPGPNYVLADNTVVTAIGWGSLAFQGASPEQLQHVDVYTINHQLCTDRYAYLKTLPNFEYMPDVTDNMLCAGILDVGGKDACQGDSGGPLAHDGDVIVGVTSWGHRCADPVYPGVNARVSRYTDWVVANA